MTFYQRSWRRLHQSIAIPSRAHPKAEKPSQDSASTPHVDLTLFRTDLQDAGIEDMVAPLLQTFVEDSPARLAALEQAVTEGDAKAIESAAHAFKSGAGTIRATILAERLAAAETSARVGRLESMATSLEEIRIECGAVLRELETFLNGR